MPERPSSGFWSRDERRRQWVTTTLVSLKLRAMEIGTDDEIHASPTPSGVDAVHLSWS